MTKIVQEAKNRPKKQKIVHMPKFEPKARNPQKIDRIAKNCPSSQILTQKPKINPNDKNRPRSQKSTKKKTKIVPQAKNRKKGQKYTKNLPNSQEDKYCPKSQKSTQMTKLDLKAITLPKIDPIAKNRKIKPRMYEKSTQ